MGLDKKNKMAGIYHCLVYMQTAPKYSILSVIVGNILGTFFVIIFAVIGTKFDNYGTKIVELSTKYNPEVIKYIP